MEKLKGMTIELDLNTLKVNRGLTGLKDRLRTVNSEMRKNMSAFDYGDKSIEKYRTRLDGLNKKLEVQRAVTEEAKAEYKRMVAEYGEGSKQAEKAAREYNYQASSLNNLERYVEKVTAEMKAFQRQQKIQNTTLYKSGDSLIRFGSGLKTVSDQAKGLGSTLTRRITMPAAGAAAALTSITLVKGFGRLVGIDTARAKLTGLGHSAEGVESIMGSALESVKGTSFGLDEAATTAANAVAAGVKEGKELTRYLSLTGDAAAISGVSLGEMGSILNKVKTSNKAYNGELQQLSDRGLPVYQWLAKEAGVTAEEVFNMASEGKISSEMLMDAIENNIGGAAKKMGEESFTAGIANMWAAVSRLGASFLDAGGKGGGFFSQMKPLVADFTDRIDGMGGIAEKAGVKLGELFAGFLEKAKSVKSAYDNLSPTIQNLINKTAIALTAITIGLGPVLTGLGIFGGFIAKVSTGLGTLMKTIAKAGGILKILGSAFAFLTSPIGIVIVILTALTAGFITAYKKSETFRNIINKVGESIKNAFGKIKEFIQPGFDAIVNFFGETKEKINDFISSDGEQLIAAFQNIGKIISNVSNIIWKAIKWSFEQIGKIISFIMPFIESLIKSVWGNIKGVITGTLDVIMGVVKIFSGLFTGDFSKMWEGVKQLFSGSIKLIWNLINLHFVGRILKITKSFTGLFKSFLSKMWEIVKGIFTKSVSATFNTVKTGFTFIFNITKTIFNSVRSFINKIWNSILNIIKRIVTNIWTSVKNTFTTLKNGVKAIFTSTANIISKIWNGIKNTVTRLASGLWNGVKKTFTNLKNGVVNLTKNARDGVVGQWGKIKNSVSDLARDMWKAVKKRFDDMVSGAKKLPGRMKEGIVNSKNKAVDGIKSLGNSMVGKFGSVVNGMIKGINNVTGKLGIKKKIKEWKVPKFAKGTDGHKGGPMIVGEEGPELVTLPSGHSFVSPDGDTLLPDMPKGTKVLPNPLTEKLLNAEIPQYAKGVGWGTKIKDSISRGLKKAKDWMGNVWDYAKKPGKLVGKIVDNLGLKITGLSGGANTIAKGSFNYVKGRSKEYLRNMFKKAEEEGGNFKGVASSAQVQKWIRAAVGITGVPGSWIGPLSTIAMKESGGNPRAINLWDINAKRGIPSKGLMQTIDPTFNAYRKKGLDNIWNPIHNAVAAIRYIKARYKTVFNTPGIKSMMRGGPYKGYATGGLVTKKQLAWLAEEGYPEMVIPMDPKRRTDAMKLLALTGKMLGADGSGKDGNRSFPGINSVGSKIGNSDIEELKDTLNELLKDRDSTLLKLLNTTLEQNEILKKLLSKDNNVYLDGDDITEKVNKNNAIKASLSYF